MAWSNEAVYTQKPFNFAARATAAKTTMTDNTNAVLAYTAGAEGAIIVRLNARALATPSGATVLYVFTSNDGGTTLALKAAILVSSDTVSTTDPPAQQNMGPSVNDPWRLSPNERLYVAASVALASGWQFEGDGEDFTKAAG